MADSGSVFVLFLPLWSRYIELVFGNVWIRINFDDSADFFSDMPELEEEGDYPSAQLLRGTPTPSK